MKERIIPVGYKPLIINGDELEEVTDEKDSFFWTEKGYGEQEFRQFVMESQEFFQKYMAGENIDSYRIGESVLGDVYLDNCVKVKKTAKGYKCLSNGTHRCAIARKYNLPLLVFVAPE